MRLYVMVSSTIYTNHSSSETAKIIWRNRICIGCSFHGWLFKDWPFDYHDSGAFRIGLGEALHQAWVKSMTDSNWVSSRCWCIGCASGGEAGWLWFGTLTTNLLNSAEGGDVKSKSCLLFMINDQNLLMSIFVSFLVFSKTVVYLANCRVFEFFSLVKICVVYLVRWC